MIELFMPFILVCEDASAQQCAMIRGSFFETEKQCEADMMVNGLSYIMVTYGPDVHLGSLECIPVKVQSGDHT
jgi:hypothetical protein